MKDEATQTALNRIELCKQRLIAFEFATRKLDRQCDETRNAINRVRGELVADELDAYHVLMMWGNLWPEARKHAKKVAKKRFLSERHAIMQYLNLDGVHPGKWSGATEEEYRGAIEEALEE